MSLPTAFPVVRSCWVLQPCSILPLILQEHMLKQHQQNLSCFISFLVYSLGKSLTIARYLRQWNVSYEANVVTEQTEGCIQKNAVFLIFPLQILDYMQTKYYMPICIYINMNITSLRNTGFILQQLATKCSVFHLKAEGGIWKLSGIVKKYNVQCLPIFCSSNFHLF